jgi:hypothetical protein
MDAKAEDFIPSGGTQARARTERIEEHSSGFSIGLDDRHGFRGKPLPDFQTDNQRRMNCRPCVYGPLPVIRAYGRPVTGSPFCWRCHRRKPWERELATSTSPGVTRARCACLTAV